eukprot:TRINITY_DN7756_c0_g2_i1.p1 TRINITY_DN7756_c0_g2~~TRINITY_DN7756_c0_g2_i1.p1  ORF type:complete len:1429 (-),score=243.24 TRINITY_DN7756_c0_g2_i1:166-4452(-)
MDFEDFLIEYDLTEDQRRLADRLKAQANLRQLLNSLADHALFFSRAKVRRPAAATATTRRKEVLAWFSGLGVDERVALLTCNDASWVQTALKMSRHRGPEHTPEGHFKVSLQSRSQSNGQGRKARASSHAVVTQEPVVHYRRPHRLPDGEVLLPLVRPKYRQACAALSRGLRVAFKGCCCASMAFHWGAIIPSPAMVADCKAFVDMMDEVSLGRFLMEDHGDELRASSTGWTEAPWLGQWGSHFPMAAFFASRLEVLLVQGYADRDNPEAEKPSALPLSQVWASMPEQQRRKSLGQLGRSLVRRLLSETLATMLGDGNAAACPGHTAELLLEALPGEAWHGAAQQPQDGLAELQPLDFVGAVSTVALPLATGALEVTGKEVLLNAPRIWLHQQFAEELAIACSEHSAALLLGPAPGPGESRPRLSKKQKQKLRRRRAQEEVQAQADGLTESLVEPESLAKCLEQEMPEQTMPNDSEAKADSQNEIKVAATLQTPIESELYCVPRAFSIDDGQHSETISSAASASFRDFGPGLRASAARLLLPGATANLLWDAELRRGLRRGWTQNRSHDDSRLEFLLRSRDRYASDFEWDRMSQGSVPASLDEAAMYPVGLESRFAYLFDSPPRSHVTTALASQATAEDDAERLQAQWEDDDIKEWENLTQALQKAEGEREMWRSKAAGLELELELLRTPQCSDEALTRPSSNVSSPEVEKNSPALTAVERRRSTRPSVGGSSNASLHDDDIYGRWRYLALLVLARRQLDCQRVAQVLQERACSPSGSPEESEERDLSAAVASVTQGRLQRALSIDVQDFSQTAPLESQRKRALVTLSARIKGGQCCEAATQTAPAITLSKMYGGIVPRYIQRELARLRQENQLLRYRIASVAMSQPLQAPRPMRHQATQTAPALTFLTGVRGASAYGLGVPGSGFPRIPQRVAAAVPHTAPQHVGFPPVFEPGWLPPDFALGLMEASIAAFVRAVDVQTEGQAPYRRGVLVNCKRVAQTLWPRCSVELYGSFASGIGLPSSGLDLVIKAHQRGLPLSERAAEQLASLSPIEEDDTAQAGTEDIDAHGLKRLQFEEVSPGHSSAVSSISSGWQQQLSARLAQEKWVISDSIRVAAHAAIPVLSFITAPDEVKRVTTEEESLACSTRVDMCVHDSSHRGLRSKALVNWLLKEYPLARPVTLVLKQWLIEQAYSMSHSGGLCSYGLLLMVVAFLQHFPMKSTAAALVGFLNFFGRRFDPQVWGVSVARGAFLPRKDPRSWPKVQSQLVERDLLTPRDALPEFSLLARQLEITGEEAHRFDPLWVEDPVNPTNNVGRNCFRIRQMQRSLARAADALATSEAGAALRSILRVDGQTEQPGQEADGLSWRESMQAKHDLHEDLWASLTEHGPNLMLPMSAQGQMARSHLPQQWDSVVRYSANALRLLGAGRRC